MTGTFADHVQLSLEVIALQSIGRADEKLHDVRLRRARSRPHIRFLRADRYFAPAQALLTLFGNDRLHGLHALLALGLNRWQKHQAGAKPPLGWQLHAQILLCHLAKEALRQTDQNTGTVTSVRLATTTPAVLHVHQHLQRIEHILMARFTLQIRHKSNAAAILLISRVIEALLLGKTRFKFVTHVIYYVSLDWKPSGLMDLGGGNRLYSHF